MEEKQNNNKINNTPDQVYQQYIFIQFTYQLLLDFSNHYKCTHFPEETTSTGGSTFSVADPF